MKLDYALRVAHELQRYRGSKCRKRDDKGWYVRQTFFPMCTRAEAKRAGTSDKNVKLIAKTRNIWVRLDRLKSEQRCLGRPRLMFQLRRYPFKRLPTVIALGRGWFLLWDGNHRAAAGALLGKHRIKCQEVRR